MNKDYIETFTECLSVLKPSVSLNHNTSLGTTFWLTVIGFRVDAPPGMTAESR